jgi:hypothetical protein
MEMTEIDEKLAIANRRLTFFTEEEVRELMGDEWSDANPPRLDLYTTSVIINGLLDLRLELMDNDTPEEVEHDSESVQEELDALLGTDLGVG